MSEQRLRMVVSPEQYEWAVATVLTATTRYMAPAQPGGHRLIPTGIEHARWIVEGVGQQILIVNPEVEVESEQGG